MSSEHNPPGWGSDDPLTVLKRRIPAYHNVGHNITYDPDATERHQLTIIETFDETAPVLFEAEGTRAAIVGKLLVWLQGRGL